MTKIKTSPSADAKLLQMLTYNAQDSKENALSFINELENQTRKTLTTLPQSGKPHRGNTRYLVVMENVVVYEYDKGSDIIHILHYYGKGEDWK